MSIRYNNRLPRLGLVHMMHGKGPIAALQSSLEINLLMRSGRTHQVRLPNGILVASIDLPEVPGLAIKADDFLHRGVLLPLPVFDADVLGSRQDQHAGLDLELVRVPELLLLGLKGLVHVAWHHVLDPDDLGVPAMT